MLKTLCLENEEESVMAKVDIPTLASQIVEGLGGKENLAQINHCATRLRVVVNDPAKLNTEGLKKTKGVLGVEVSGDQVQVIVGQIIEDLFLAVEKKTGTTSKAAAGPKKKKTVMQVFSDFLLMMAGIMSPIIPALITAGFLSTLLTILQWCSALTPAIPLMRF